LSLAQAPEKAAATVQHRRAACCHRAVVDWSSVADYQLAVTRPEAAWSLAGLSLVADWSSVVDWL